MSAYTRCGFARDIASPTLPCGRVGRPVPVRRVHVTPASVLFQIPLPGPPLVRPHVFTSICHVAAKRVLGSVGCMTTSIPPVLSLTNRTRCQVRPPSAVL